MDFDTEHILQYHAGNSSDSDKRNYFQFISEKSQRDSYFYRDSDMEYSYGDQRWK